MAEVININGVKYTEEDFNEEQSYLIKQIRSCKVKSINLTFEIDQIKVAEQAFTTAFLSSIEKSKEDISKYKPLIKLYDKADIINDLA